MHAFAYELVSLYFHFNSANGEDDGSDNAGQNVFKCILRRWVSTESNVMLYLDDHLDVDFV